MIKIIGTSHISSEVLEKIRKTIKEEEPDCVALELDANRFEALRRGERVSYKAIKHIGLMNYLLAKLLSLVQVYLGKKTGVMPGAEMLVAARSAAKENADIALIDRDIRITLGRMRTMPLSEKLGIVLSVFKKHELEVKFDLKKVPSEKLVRELIGELRKISPTLCKVLIDERDEYMTRALKELGKKYPKIVVVVGMGHKSGIQRNLRK